MSNHSTTTRANLLAQMASDSSVTTDVLADEERQFEESRLVGPPPITHLEESEAPAYVLTNAKRGIGLGSKRNTTSPDSNRGTVCLVTGRRTLCLVGTRPDDEIIEVPHESVAAVSSHTGWRANRLEIRTPRKMYHIWVDRHADETVAAAAKFIDEHRQNEPEEITGQDGASRVMWRGQPVRQATGTAGNEHTVGDTDESDAVDTDKAVEEPAAVDAGDGTDGSGREFTVSTVLTGLGGAGYLLKGGLGGDGNE